MLHGAISIGDAATMTTTRFHRFTAFQHLIVCPTESACSCRAAPDGTCRLLLLPHLPTHALSWLCCCRAPTPPAHLKLHKACSPIMLQHQEHKVHQNMDAGEAQQQHRSEGEQRPHSLLQWPPVRRREEEMDEDMYQQLAGGVLVVRAGASRGWQRPDGQGVMLMRLRRW